MISDVETATYTTGERGRESVMKVSVKFLVTFTKYFTKKSQEAVKIRL